MLAPVLHSLLLQKENSHEDPIYCCAWTKTCLTEDPKGPTKDFILTGGLDCSVKIWAYENNKLELYHTLEEHPMAVVSIAVSPDGYNIASSSIDSSLIISDLLSGQKVHKVKTNATDVWKVVFSPDGSQVATGTHTGKIIVYGIRNGTTDKVLDTRGRFVLCVAWSPNGKYLSSGAVDGTVCIFDVAQGKLVHTIQAHSDTVRSVAFSPNSKLLLTASGDFTVKLYNVASAGHISTLEHKCWAVCAIFSPDGGRIATAATDGSIKLALVDDLTVLATFREHTDIVWDIQFNKTGDQLMSVGKDKLINIYTCPILPKSVVKK